MVFSEDSQHSLQEIRMDIGKVNDTKNLTQKQGPSNTEHSSPKTENFRPTVWILVDPAQKCAEFRIDKILKLLKVYI